MSGEKAKKSNSSIYLSRHQSSFKFCLPTPTSLTSSITFSRNTALATSLQVSHL